HHPTLATNDEKGRKRPPSIPPPDSAPSSTNTTARRPWRFIAMDGQSRRQCNGSTNRTGWNAQYHRHRRICDEFLRPAPWLVVALLRRIRPATPLWPHIRIKPHLNVSRQSSPQARPLTKRDSPLLFRRRPKQ